MRKHIIIYCSFFLLSTTILHAQTVLVTDDSTYISGQASAVLDLKSTTKGFLPPRVTAAQKEAISSPATGLMVYQTDGIAGYYLWTGTRWEPLVSGLGGLIPVNKTVSDTLTKTQTFVLASNDITLTLPVITSADNGLSITVKNIGTYTDLVLVAANGAATVDGSTNTSPLTRWQAKTYVAYEGNWLLKQKEDGRQTIRYEVSVNSSWTTIPEALAFLAAHMTAASELWLGSGTYQLTATQTINLPYPLTIAGISFGETTIAAATGLTGSPMFSCASETYFKMLKFDATTLASYGTASGEDAIWLTGTGIYHEIKDNEFNGFNKAVVVKNNVDLWMFENNIRNAAGSGVEIAAGTAINLSFRISETDFMNCTKGISLTSGGSATLTVQNCGFFMSNPTDVCIDYVPATFTDYKSLSISGNTWNTTGIFIQGFDFTRSDGRDANCLIQSNAGVSDYKPSCRISVVNNGTGTSFGSTNTWYKAIWTNTDVVTTSWAISNNRITYLPGNKRDAFMVISGDVSVGALPRNLTIALMKNGSTAIQYGLVTLKLTVILEPIQFSTVVYLKDINKNDYFEVYCKIGGSTGDTITFNDVHWVAETK